MTKTEAHREFRPYTKSGVFKTKLSGPQMELLELAGHGAVITGNQIQRTDGRIYDVVVPWTSLRSMADKGAVEVIERVVRQGPRGPINGKILAVRVK